MTQLPSSLSPSKLTAFKDCPRAFRYANIDKLPEVPSPHLVLGTFVHLALQNLYGVPSGDRLNQSVNVLASAWSWIRRSEDYLALELDENAITDFCSDADRLFTNALLLEDPDTVDVHATEQKIEAEVDGVLYRGIIDRIDAVPGGGYGVVDYKTGRVPAQDKERSKLEGVYFYALLCEQVYGTLPEWVRLDYLATPISVTCIPTAQAVRGIRQRGAAAWAAIESACEHDEFLPRQSSLCNWCSYRALCPLFGGRC